jgi:uncharacterized lipoprotein YmbA
MTHSDPTCPAQRRRRLLLAGAMLLLGGCAVSSAPVRLYRLRLDAPQASRPDPDPAAAVWEVSAALVLPEYLERDAIVVARGDAGLQALADERWAEPLRDSLPRLLRHDLALLRGADRVWPAPAPAGVKVARRLQVEVQELLASADRAALLLQVRWWLTDPAARAAPLAGQAVLQVPLAGLSAEQIASAHRLAWWQLAGRIAATPA